jgi:hypothetical protein
MSFACDRLTVHTSDRMTPCVCVYIYINTYMYIGYHPQARCRIAAKSDKMVIIYPSIFFWGAIYIYIYVCIYMCI